MLWRFVKNITGNMSVNKSHIAQLLFVIVHLCKCKVIELIICCIVCVKCRSIGNHHQFTRLFDLCQFNYLTVTIGPGRSFALGDMPIYGVNPSLHGVVVFSWRSFSMASEALYLMLLFI